uniref:C2HC/C3H-type domain-containing protein n=1 Tax=Euplotes harpa TaxID=151035 RepID=A0A7S3J3F7_9SPIT|mmetsp:Transcript_14615/g.16868  ORF Transcript_14615/g.16868 Transcript_14615/m.16868 type:complete len:369 (+) Transcript_14615:3-1109(+)
MSRAEKNAQAALDWAKKKKEQMERAKQLREERKNQLKMVAENSISSGSTPNYGGLGDDTHTGFRQRDNDDDNSGFPGYVPERKYIGMNRGNAGYSDPPNEVYSPGYGHGGGSGYRPSSTEDIEEARKSLMLLKSKIKNKNAPRSMSSANAGTHSGMGDQAPSNGNYRKVFKPNLGDQDNMSEGPRRGASNRNVNHTFQGGDKPPSRPPVNSRLKPKLPQRSGGKYNDMDEQQIEYEPVKRTSGMRSSRVSDSGSVSKASMSKASTEMDSNFPGSYSGMNSGAREREMKKQTKPPVKAGYGKLSAFDNDDHDSAQIKPIAGSYVDNLGEEAFQKATNLKPCPSCGRNFNDEALVKHKKVCKKVFQTKAK